MGRFATVDSSLTELSSTRTLSAKFWLDVLDKASDKGVEKTDAEGMKAVVRAVESGSTDPFVDAGDMEEYIRKILSPLGGISFAMLPSPRGAYRAELVVKQRGRSATHRFSVSFEYDKEKKCFRVDGASGLDAKDFVRAVLSSYAEYLLSGTERGAEDNVEETREKQRFLVTSERRGRTPVFEER